MTFFKEFGGPVHDFLISYLVSFISFWIQITFCEVCFSVMKQVYMSCRESERGVRCVRDMFQKALRCHWWWMDRTGAVPVVWVPQEQSLTSCTAVRGSVAAVYRRRNRILLLTWNMNGKPLIVFISGIDLISKILYPGIYNIPVLAKYYIYIFYINIKII